MKHNILLTTLAMLILTAALPARADEDFDRPAPPPEQEQNYDDIWQDINRPDRKAWLSRLPEDKIDRILFAIERHAPERGQQLQQLREDDPDQFYGELHDTVRDLMERHFDEMVERHAEKLNPRPEPGEEDFPAPQVPDRFQGRGNRPETEGDRPDQHRGRKPRMQGREMLKQRMENKQRQFLNWLEEQYPEQAEMLRQTLEENPDRYGEKLAQMAKKYGQIMSAEKDNPELAEILKTDLELKDQRDELLQEILAAEGSEREQLIEELREVISIRFDLIVRQKELQYENLRERLERLEHQLEKREAEVRKLEEKKDDAVESRLSELVDETEQIDWD